MPRIPCTTNTRPMAPRPMESAARIHRRPRSPTSVRPPLPSSVNMKSESRDAERHEERGRHRGIPAAVRGGVGDHRGGGRGEEDPRAGVQHHGHDAPQRRAHRRCGSPRRRLRDRRPRDARAAARRRPGRSRTPPPTTRSARSRSSLGASDENPNASATMTRKRVPLAPSITRRPPESPRLAVSVRSRSCTGPGAAPSANPNANAAPICDVQLTRLPSPRRAGAPRWRSSRRRTTPGSLALRERLDDVARQAERGALHQGRVADRQAAAAVRDALEQCADPGRHPVGSAARRVLSAETGHHFVIGELLTGTAQEPGGGLRRPLGRGDEHHVVGGRRRSSDVLRLGAAGRRQPVRVGVAAGVSSELELSHVRMASLRGSRIMPHP